MTLAYVDPRTARTVASLEAALRALLEERALDDITVTDLTAQARITRPSFYTHYRSITDFVACILTREIEALVSPQHIAEEGADLGEVMLSMSGAAFSLVAGNRLLFRRALESASAGPVRAALTTLVSERLREAIAIEFGDHPAFDVPLAVAFSVGGFIALVENWACSEGDDLSPDRWTAAIEQSIPRWWDDAKRASAR